MSRYTGPRLKIMRALGEDLPGLSPKKAEYRPYPPGQHGNRRRKETEYGKRLKEKQKLRFNYGLTEGGMRRLFAEASRSKENSGLKLLELLERRLDNVVFRAGFARSIPAARQIINHGHVQIKERRVDIPSYRVRPGEEIRIKPAKANIDPVKLGVELAQQRRWETSWLESDLDQRKAKVLSMPTPESITFHIDIQLVIEFYARSG